jgi:hypothetical protein
MDLHRYASQLDGLRAELIASLSAADRQQLKSSYAHLSLNAIFERLKSSQDEIEKFVAATPNQRKTLKKWRDREVRLLLTLGALYHVQQAHAYISSLANSSVLYDQSYRQMVIAATNAFSDMLENHPFRFPLDDLD